MTSISRKATHYYLYMLECSNSAFYIGYTTDIERRWKEHLLGSAKCKYTRSFPPRRMVACWLIEDDRSFALSLERKLKSLSRLEKALLAQRPNDLKILLPELALQLDAVNIQAILLGTNG